MTLQSRLKELEKRAASRTTAAENDYRFAGLPVSHVDAREICNLKRRIAAGRFTAEARAALEAQLNEMKIECERQRRRDFKDGKIDEAGDARPHWWSWQPPADYGDRFGEIGEGQ